MKKYCYSSLLFAHEDARICVHPDDHQMVKSAYPSGWRLKCFEYCGVEEGYDLLSTNDIHFRVKDAVVTEIKCLQYFYGEEVFVIRKNMNGKVVGVFWHLKRNEPHYVIECGGVESGYRYFNTDLQRAKV